MHACVHVCMYACVYNYMLANILLYAIGIHTHSDREASLDSIDFLFCTQCPLIRHLHKRQDVTFYTRPSRVSGCD